MTDLFQDFSWDWRETDVKVKCCTFDDLPDGIFVNNDWVREMSKLHFTPVFVQDTSWQGKSVDDREMGTYLVLLFLYEGKNEQLVDYPDGIPLREQFLESLHQWKWVDKKLHDISIRSRDVTLSIGSYYIRTTEPENLVNEIDMSKFIDLTAGTVRADNRPLVLYFPQEPKYENGDPVEIVRGDRVLFNRESYWRPGRPIHWFAFLRLEIPRNSQRKALYWHLWDKETISFEHRKDATFPGATAFTKFINKLES